MYSNLSFLFKGGPDHPSGRVLPRSKASLAGFPRQPSSGFPQPSALQVPPTTPSLAELQPCRWASQPPVNWFSMAAEVAPGAKPEALG